MSHVLVHASARLRMFLVRHRSIYWLLVVAIAAAAAAMVASEVADARAARDAWTETRPALVANHALPAGTLITSADITITSLPRAAVPPSALSALTAGLVTRDDVTAGEVLLIGHLGPAAANELPPGTRGIAVPRDAGSLPLIVGTIVDLIAVDDPLGSSVPQQQELISDGAVVVSVTDDVAVVAVEESVAAGAASAAGRGRVVMIWRGGPLASAAQPATES